MKADKSILSSFVYVWWKEEKYKELEELGIIEKVGEEQRRNLRKEKHLIFLQINPYEV